MNFPSLDQLFVWMNEAVLERTPGALAPWVEAGIKIAVIATLAPVIMMYLTWFERKVIARMQNRFGPDRVGTYGLLQPLADGVKMFLKEDLVPRGSDAGVHLLAPIIAVAPAIMLFAVLPFGRNMAPADLNVGLLYLLAVGAVGAYSIFMGGWASHSKFPVMGAMRAVAQIVSYEVPQVVSLVAIVMVTGTLSLVHIVEAQEGLWFFFTPWGFVSGLIFFICGVAEVNRTPFDMPEAESELVGGFHTEYSGMKFALWYMAEFLESFTVCAFTVTLFLGGWQGPAIPFWVLAGILLALIATAQRLSWAAKGVLGLPVLGLLVVFGFEAIPSWIWFLSKTYLLMFVLVWFRGTFPRLRVDQLMGFAWKFLLPMALVTIIAAGLSVWFGGWAGALWSLAVLLLAFWAMVRINNPASIQKRRVYVFAD